MEPTANTISLTDAPLPTARTLRLRRNIFFQFFRFAAFNLKMIRIIAGGH